MLLAMDERQFGVADRLACCFSDRGDPTPISSRPSYSSRVGWNSVSHGQLDHRLREVIELSASRQLLPIAAVASKARRISRSY